MTRLCDLRPSVLADADLTPAYCQGRVCHGWALCLARPVPPPSHTWPQPSAWRATLRERGKQTSPPNPLSFTRRGAMRSRVPPSLFLGIARRRREPLSADPGSGTGGGGRSPLLAKERGRGWDLSALSQVFSMPGAP